jgi:hypothetical protein
MSFTKNRTDPNKKKNVFKIEQQSRSETKNKTKVLH